MKKNKISLMVLIALLSSLFMTGCWNYREIDKMAIVAGIAVDKGADGQYVVTVETLKISSGKDTKISSEIVVLEGRTLFDAVRNGISLTGKRLYWSHAKVIILSKEIASEGVTKVLDWYVRDAETREDVNILISNEASAKEILEGQSTNQDIKSYALDEILKNQDSLSKAPITDILLFGIEAQTKGASAVIPSVNLRKTNGETVPQIMGTAIIKHDKLVGFLNGDETKDLLFVRNEVKGGVLVEGATENKSTLTTPVSIEIFSSKTKVTPIMSDMTIKMMVDIDITAAIDEIDGTEDYIDENGRMKLEKRIENTIRKRIESVIRKMETEYDADIFGFGTKLQEDQPKAWKRLSNHWEGTFKDLTVDIKTRVHIKNSALLSKTLKEGD